MRLEYRVDLIRVCAAWGTLTVRSLYDWQNYAVVVCNALCFIGETFWQECMSPVIPKLEPSVSSA